MTAILPFISRGFGAARDVSARPEFSLWPLLLVVVAKPVTDAFYEVNAVKYGYMAALFIAAFFARCGQMVGRNKDSTPGVGVSFIFWVVAYFYFLFGIAVSFGGSWQEIFKIVSPFAFFMMVYFAADRRLAPILATGAALVILVNAALLPTEFGWKDWGGVPTFKGFYYFKTDLAYSLIFSILMLAVYYRLTIHPLLIALVAVASVQIIFANSRLNYVALAAVLAFLAQSGEKNLKALVRLGILAAVFAALIAYAYQANKLLGFDLDNLSALTQGRDRIWGSLVAGISGFSVQDWLFGRGMYADFLLSAEERTIFMAEGAHNELLHLIMTQGIIGSSIYLFLWIKMFKLCHRGGIPKWLRAAGLASAALFLLQGMTTVVSSFATKTWPLVLILLMIRAMADREIGAGHRGNAR